MPTLFGYPVLLTALVDGELVDLTPTLRSDYVTMSIDTGAVLDLIAAHEDLRSKQCPICSIGDG